MEQSAVDRLIAEEPGLRRFMDCSDEIEAMQQDLTDLASRISRDEIELDASEAESIMLDYFTSVLALSLLSRVSLDFQERAGVTREDVSEFHERSSFSAFAGIINILRSILPQISAILRPELN